jgi:hypothetical protein
MRRVDVCARDRPARALTAEPLDVVREITLVFRPLDLHLRVLPPLVVERDDERDVPLPAVAGVVPTDIEATGVVRQVALEVPALAGTVFLLDRRDGDDDRFACAFELELDRPTGIFVPIEEREHQIELARATNRVERQLVNGSHTTSPCNEHFPWARREIEPRCSCEPPPHTKRNSVYSLAHLALLVKCLNWTA